jgi:hypothetical protein
MMMRTLTLVMMVERHKMVMTAMNNDPKISILQLVVLPHLKPLGHLKGLTTREYIKILSYSHPHESLQVLYDLYVFV